MQGGQSYGPYQWQSVMGLLLGSEGGNGADENTDGTVMSAMITDNGECGFLVSLMVLTMEQNSSWTWGEWPLLPLPTCGKEREGLADPLKALLLQTAIPHLMKGEEGSWLIAKLRPTGEAPRLCFRSPWGIAQPGQAASRGVSPLL